MRPAGRGGLHEHGARRHDDEDGQLRALGRRRDRHARRATDHGNAGVGPLDVAVVEPDQRQRVVRALVRPCGAAQLHLRVRRVDEPAPVAGALDGGLHAGRHLRRRAPVGGLAVDASDRQFPQPGVGHEAAQSPDRGCGHARIGGRGKDLQRGAATVEVEGRETGQAQ